MTFQAFIVRPFGTKEVTKRDKATGDFTTVTIDFDLVEKELIAPALEAVNLLGGTTGKIFEAGDIREDMFSLLLLADVVIADITIHNANAFYELGIRHAFRDKKTILLKCPGLAETPFDILGYRYISYEKEDPAAALSDLIRALKDTLIADRQDSPVFKVLPWLKARDTEKYLIIPEDFRKEVQFYIRIRQTDRLALLTEEVRGFAWEVPALRLIGEGQFRLKGYEGARQTWEQILRRIPHDREANDRLSTIYNRLAEAAPSQVQQLKYLALCDQAVTHLLNTAASLEQNRKAEVYALLARNTKGHWMASWSSKPTTHEKQVAALTSPFLRKAYEYYERGFTEDLNHYYSGGNALGLLSVMIALAELQPGTWEIDFESTEKAQLALNQYKDRQKELGRMVKGSIEAAEKRSEYSGKEDPWLLIALADVSCMIESRPERVRLLYEMAIKSLIDFNLDSARRQLLIYKELGVLSANVEAALNVFPTSPSAPETHFLLFTGHMIDKEGRVDQAGNPDPRFPVEKEANARQAIFEKVKQEQEKVECQLLGLAGGACGGDILFHEVCQELGIPTQLLLALPRDQFLNESVQFAGPQWVERFDAIYHSREKCRETLSETKELPNWLKKKPSYSIWERNNLWMLHKALANGGECMTLIALWDGKPGDAGGGTEHMVMQAQARGAKTVVINVKELN
ncbi:tetratricopeptide repeat-containing protein [Telluribacter sp.]|jgi:hypothetical protein|uniref:tetratricopeptide repeat-containing protein n=1 Tax=Telluribacter sp. TaxID=1978767 RepID=UPI002E1281CB|nr:tetratricopeptide repeat-containing protein [Telluribacter sp.]